ncbi:MAG: AAA family ATPase [Bacilli bacterium]|nr:AAA family ATPase [Bacilli bacterium]
MIILAGASASGKTEVAKELAKTYHIVKTITTTTRPMRVGEADGKDYFFVSKERFLEMIKEGRFVEYTIYNGNYYGSTKDQIASDKCVVIDPAGLRAYKKLNDKTIITFFLDAYEDTRYQRMLLRGDEVNKAKNRILNDREAFNPKLLEEADFHIDSEHQTVEEVAKIVYDLYTHELANRLK